MTAQRKRRIFAARSLIPFGRGKRVRIPRGPRHCHRGRPGQETTGRVRSVNGRAPGKEPDGERSGSQETCRTERFLRRGKERGRALDFPRRGTPSSSRRDSSRRTGGSNDDPVPVSLPSPFASRLRRRARSVRASRLGVRRRHRDPFPRGRRRARLGDDRHHARAHREERRDDGSRAASIRPGHRRPATGRRRRPDVALSARHEFDARARPRRWRPRELAVLSRLRLLGADDRKRRADRDRARPVLGALRLGRDRRRHPDPHPDRDGASDRPGHSRGG